MEKKAKGKRMVIDCRDFPNEVNCTLLVSGSIKEVINVSLRHAIEDHGHKDTKELRKQLKAMIKPFNNKQKGIIK